MQLLHLLVGFDEKIWRKIKPMARSGLFLMTQKCLQMEWRLYNLSAEPSQNKEQKCIFSGTKILCKTPVENKEPVVIGLEFRFI